MEKTLISIFMDMKIQYIVVLRGFLKIMTYRSGTRINKLIQITVSGIMTGKFFKSTEQVSVVASFF
jgi:hypothetical protein